MSQLWNSAFYKTTLWKNTRKAYAKSVGGLCERCLKNGLYNPGEIVHHKVHLTKENVTDPSVATNFENLELLCRKCHAEEHDEVYGKRYHFNADGSIAPHLGA